MTKLRRVGSMEMKVGGITVSAETVQVDAASSSPLTRDEEWHKWDRAGTIAFHAARTDGYTPRDAAEMVGVSVRQMERYAKEYVETGLMPREGRILGVVNFIKEAPRKLIVYLDLKRYPRPQQPPANLYDPRGIRLRD